MSISHGIAQGFCGNRPPPRNIWDISCLYGASSGTFSAFVQSGVLPSCCYGARNGTNVSEADFLGYLRRVLQFRKAYRIWFVGFHLATARRAIKRKHAEVRTQVEHPG